MKRTLFLALVTLLAAGCSESVSNESTESTQDAIIGGEDVRAPYSFMVSLRVARGRHYCGGSLVAPQWIVTANHCVERGLLRTAAIGSNDVRRGEVIAIERTIAFPNPSHGGDDIALVKLTRPARSAPIAMAENAPEPGTAVRLMGWGDTSYDPPAPDPIILQQIDLEVVSNDRCPLDRHPGAGVCISGSPDQSACHGDSGGPAVVRSGATWSLVGATSGVGNPDEPHCGGTTIYSGVAQHLAWIRQQIEH